MNRISTMLMAVFLFSVSIVFAQEKTINGKVTDGTDGTPLPGVSVVLKGATNVGVTTNAAGLFRIKVPASATTLSFRSIGYITQDVQINGRTDIDVVLKADVKSLSEVVVTAFGIKQEKKALGYAVQEVGSLELTRSRDPNIVNALQGKVAGVNIQNSGGAAGAGASILIRGISSLGPTANNQPLFVVDGIPISNETIAGNVLPSAGSASPASSEQFSFTNRAADLNPDDIESLSILKGPAATALYGIRAANGVVVITTKRGVAGMPLVSFTSSLGFDNVVKFPEIQRTYREGLGGILRLKADGTPNRFQTFGPPVQPGDPIYENFRDFFNTGMKFNNSVSLSGGSDKVTYYSSASHLYQKGIVPGSDYNKTTLKLSGNYNMSSKFSVNASANYSISGGIKPSAGDKGVMSDLSYFSPTFDVNDYIYPDGSMKSYAPGVIDNPVYAAKYSTLKDKVNRLIGNMGFTYKPTDWLTFDYKLGGDFYSDSRTRIVPGPRFPGDPTTLDLALGVGGFIVEDRINFKEINSNFFVTANKKLNDDFEATLMLGNSVQSQRTDQVNTRGEKFGLPFFYDLSNTSNLYAFRQETKRNVFGLFADAKLAYKNAIFLNITGRNDWSSTLPVSNQSFFYPSVNLSYVFSDLHHLTNDWFTYGKVRFSVASVGKDAQPYSNGPYFASYLGFPFNGIPGFNRTSTLSDPNLKPERTNSIEAGTELRFFKNRLGFDLTLYKQHSRDQIIEVPISYETGYSKYITNAGEIQNKGIELLLTGTPVKGDFSWDVSVNWSLNRSKVLSIKDGINEIPFNSNERIVNKLVVGGSAGDLYGRVYNRDANGNLIIDANGFPGISQTFVKVGNAFPKWQGGITNTFRYKGISLSALLEWRNGGDVHDVSMRNSIRNGILKITEDRYKQVVFKGVLADGTPNTKAVMLDESFYRGNENLFNGASEVILQDASWLRLRNITLSYEIPKKFLPKNKMIKSLTISAAGNNFLLWTPFKGYDPEGSSYGSGSNAYGYMGYNIPSTRNYSFTLNANF